MSRIAWDALVSQVAQIFRSDTLMLGWECGNLETWLQKMWDILWKWILQFPFGADHDSFRLVSYFNFFTRWSNNVLLIFWFVHFGSLAVLAISPAISDHPQGWLQGKPGVTTAEETELSKENDCHQNTLQAPAIQWPACKRWWSVFNLGIFDRCWRCRIWRNRRWVDGWLCLFRGLE